MEFHIFVTTFTTLLLLVEADHFRGAAIMWKPAGSLNVSVTFRAAWTRSYYPCNNLTIQSGELFEDGSNIGCLNTSNSYCSTNFGQINNIQIRCTDYSDNEDWSFGEKTLVHTVTSQGPFTVGFTGWAWIDTSHTEGAGWSLPTTINLIMRNDIGKPNSSPRALFSPNITLGVDCLYSVPIAVTDPDDDLIQCRWAVGTDECGGICKDFSGVNLDKKCMLNFTHDVTPGLYGIAVMVEDFSPAQPTEPLSKIPVQFLVNIVNSSSTCASMPVYTGDTPKQGDEIFILMKVTWQQVISVQTSDSNIKINEINTISPVGLDKSNIALSSPRIYYVTLTWTPSQEQIGKHSLCYKASDTHGMQAELRCVTLTVETDYSAPNLTFLSNPYYTGQTVLITWTYNEPVSESCYLKTPDTQLVEPTFCNKQWSGDNLAYGQYTLYINSTDAFGNMAAHINHSWYVVPTCRTYVPICFRIRPKIGTTMVRSQMKLLGTCMQKCVDKGQCCGLHFNSIHGSCMTYRVNDLIQPLTEEHGWMFYD